MTMQKLRGPILALAVVALVGATLALAGVASATEATALASAPAARESAGPVLEAAVGGWTGAPGALLLLLLAGLAAAMERVR